MKAEDLKQFEMLMIDNKTGFPFIGSYRAIVSGMTAFAGLRQNLIRSIGWEKVNAMLGRFGYEVGIEWATVLAEMYAFDSEKEWLKACGVMLTMAGVAHVWFDKMEIDKEKKYLRVIGDWYDSFEVMIGNSNLEDSDAPVCTVIAGIISGYASTVLGVEVHVKETKCQSQGHEYCSFEGRVVRDWGLNPEELRRYYDLEPISEELARLRGALFQAKEDIARQHEEIKLLKQQKHRPYAEQEVIYRSEQMGRLLFMAEKVAPTESAVLIEGESGTGKDVLARFIHRHSGRSNEPYVAINCAALPPNLLESELFGHKKGSFTGADRDKKGLFKEAGTGTLFLDEVGELPLELQAKLLRSLQMKAVRPVGGLKDEPIHARIVAATNRALKEMVKEGRFREDLFYRLAVFPIHMAPLRERREDILLLARHFLSRFNLAHPGFAPRTVRIMESYHWPGNVRELKNWIEHAVVMAGDELIQPVHLPLAMAQESEQLLSSLTLDFPTCEDLEKRYTQMVLDHTRGNRKKAARILGKSISTLWRRLKERDESQKRLT